jgi:hypothetical protein
MERRSIPLHDLETAAIDILVAPDARIAVNGLKKMNSLESPYHPLCGPRLPCRAMMRDS